MKQAGVCVCVMWNKRRVVRYERKQALSRTVAFASMAWRMAETFSCSRSSWAVRGCSRE